MTDYENYLCTLSSPTAVEYTDQQQNSYDWNDEYQGCASYMEYCETWA